MSLCIWNVGLAAALFPRSWKSTDTILTVTNTTTGSFSTVTRTCYDLRRECQYIRPLARRIHSRQLRPDRSDCHPRAEPQLRRNHPAHYQRRESVESRIPGLATL